MGHPDFRVGGKIFATLGYPDGAWAMVKLTPEQQEAFVAADPTAFAPVKGGWGRGGATNVRLRRAKVKAVRTALLTAWRNVAPLRGWRGRSRSAESRSRTSASPPRRTTVQRDHPIAV